MDGVRALGLGARGRVARLPRGVAGRAGARAHDPAYLAELEAFCAEGGGDIDADTYARPDSWTAARRAAGAGLAALAELERRGEGVAFVAGPTAGPPRHRRPGHGLLPPQQRGRRRGVAHGARASGS